MNGEEISVSDFRNRVQYERFELAEQIRANYNSAIDVGLDEEQAQRQTLSVFSGQESNGAIDVLLSTEAFGPQVLDEVEREKLIEQKAEEFGVTAEVDDAKVQEVLDEIAAQINRVILTETPSPTPSDVPSETPTPLVSSTPSSTPSDTPTPTETVPPTAEGCAEDATDCPTITPQPTATITETPTETPEVTETPTRTIVPPEVAKSTVAAYEDEFFDQGSDYSGLDEDAIRNIFYHQALLEAMRDYITMDEEQFPDYFVGEQEIWVDARHILISFPQDQVVAEGDENTYFDEAQRIYEALNAGEPFAALAEANSDDPGSGSRGGIIRIG
ncbi:MAG TPA: peptidylprolyl isomerase, partial [Aggregatilineales bacterium]|nr:peptidylprolyl isomerase [Aggregatilineales bacterium]